MSDEKEFIFSFPRCEAAKIRVKGETYGEAADKAIEIRTKQVTPLKADGELYVEKGSLTTPVTGTDKK